MAANRFCYQLDAEDRIADEEEVWLAFARENGARLTRESVLGRPLWEFIDGREIRQLYKQVFGSVRTQRRVAIIPFRCDSPTMRRHMKLQIELVDGGRLKLCGVLLAEEPRPYISLLDEEAPRGEKEIRVCSCCRKFEIQDDHWGSTWSMLSAIFVSRRGSRCPICTTTCAVTVAPSCWAL